MNKTLFYATLFLLSGCVSAKIAESIKVNNVLLSLNKEKYIVHVNNETVAVNIGGDCHFIKQGHTGSVHVEHYKDIDSHVVLIVGDPIVNDTIVNHTEHPLTKKFTDCGSTLKAIILNNTGIRVSEKTFTNTVTRASIGVDEKDYYMLSH